LTISCARPRPTDRQGLRSSAMPAVVRMDPALNARDVASVIDVWHEFPTYTAVGQKPRKSRPSRPAEPARTNPRKPLLLVFAPRLEPREDTGFNQQKIRTHAQSQHRKYKLRGGQTRYFRGTYADGGRELTPGIQSLLDNPQLADAAAQLYGRAIVEPWLVYANLFVPGQLLGVHTDVPAFRGAERGYVRPWLLVVMHHSGLFEPWRIPVATAVVYVSDCLGGDFTYFPEGGSEPTTTTFHPSANSAIMFDGDTTFHRVEPVGTGKDDCPDIEAGTRLASIGSERWQLMDPDGENVIAKYKSADLRYSVSWKAYCFADRAEREAWLHHRDDLSLASIIPTLTDELVRRGRLTTPRHDLSDEQLAYLMMDEFIPFPPPHL